MFRDTSERQGSLKGVAQVNWEGSCSILFDNLNYAIPAQNISTLLCINMEPVNQRQINMNYQNKMSNIYSKTCIDTQQILTRLSIQVLMLVENT